MKKHLYLIKYKVAFYKRVLYGDGHRDNKATHRGYSDIREKNIFADSKKGAIDTLKKKTYKNGEAFFHSQDWDCPDDIYCWEDVDIVLEIKELY